jgi:hypothetical protein
MKDPAKRARRQSLTTKNCSQVFILGKVLPECLFFFLRVLEIVTPVEALPFQHMYVPNKVVLENVVPFLVSPTMHLT